MTILNEMRKEDELYFQGAFWIIADTFKDILKGKFEIKGAKSKCDYNGDYVDLNQSKNNLRLIFHFSLWDNKFKNEINPNVSFDYYPRGRVSIYNGAAFIYLNSKCNTQKIIDTIITEYNLNKLDIKIKFNSDMQSDYCSFKLK